jgi:bifunctional DNA-binding transcriptional regulator/antitoxin component of YhaV-PrlF toxin-antitoxin module
MPRAHVDEQHRIAIPEEWRDEFPPGQEVEIEPGQQGILLRFPRNVAMARVLRRKLQMHDPVALDLSKFNSDTFSWDDDGL